MQKKLGWADDSLTVGRADQSAGPGNIVMLEIASQHVTEVFTGFGELGVRAEAVAHKAVDERGPTWPPARLSDSTWPTSCSSRWP